MSMVVGIDPGNHGALCLYDAEARRIMDIYNMPIWHQVIGKKTRPRIDTVALLELFDFFVSMDVELVVMEAVGGRPRQSASAAFVFGYGVGLVYMACVSNRIPIETVPPATWKRLMRVPKDDNGIAARADEMFPDDAQRWRGPKGAIKHDRAEAAMLAKFAGERMLHIPATDTEWRMTYRNVDTGA